MGKTKSSNKKYYVILALIIAFFLIALGAVVGVWADTSANLSPALSVGYSTTKDVSVKVKTEYQIGATRTIATNDFYGNKITDPEGFVSFGTNESGEKMVALGDIFLTPENPELIIYFTYVNVGGMDTFSIVTENFEEKDNIDVLYYRADSFEDENPWVEDDGSDLTATKTGEVQYHKIVLKVANVNKSASIKGSLMLQMSNIEFDL